MKHQSLKTNLRYLKKPYDKRGFMFSTINAWFLRVYRFNQQMFPFFPNVIIFIVQFSLSYFTLLKFLQISLDTSTITKDVITGSISLVLFVYLFRCFDEVKDYEDDKINFPTRPLVTGVVSIQDMYILQLVILTVLIILNLIVPHGEDLKMGFFIVFIFTILASRWFFAKRWIKPSLPLALLTHNPVIYLHQIYIMSFFVLSKETLLSMAGLFLLSVALPGTAWEISRKIRGHREEDTYTTYSKIWGPHIPLVLISSLLTLSLVSSFIAYKDQVAAWALILWLVPAFVLLKFIYQCFMFWKNTAKAPDFRKTVEAFVFAKILILTVAYFLS